MSFGRAAAFPVQDPWGTLSLVLIAVRSLIDRLRQPATRVAELDTLRARLAAQPSRREAGDEAAALADEIGHHKRALSEALGDVEACSGCAKGHPLPAGRWDGGHCCGGNTLTIFTRDEVAALKLAGTRGRHLVPPRDDHAGCAFRGARGCALPVTHRPSICVRYICLELRAELRDQPKWQAIAEHGRALASTFARFERALHPDRAARGATTEP